VTLTIAERERLYAWARDRRLIRTPEECTCEIGCVTCSVWLLENTIYVQGDPLAQRRRTVAATPASNGARSWQPAVTWLQTTASEPETESFRALHALLAAPAEAR